MHTLGSAYGDELINSQYQSEDVREIPIVSTFDVLFTERMKNTFRQWRDGLSRTSNEGYQFEDNSNGPMPRLLTFFFKMRPALKLNGFTSHQLRLIQLVRLLPMLLISLVSGFQVFFFFLTSLFVFLELFSSYYGIRSLNLNMVGCRGDNWSDLVWFRQDLAPMVASRDLT